MNKVIVLSTVLALGALGMAFGESAPKEEKPKSKPKNEGHPKHNTPNAATHKIAIIKSRGKQRHRS